MALLRASTDNYKGGLAIAAKVFEEYGEFIYTVISCKVRNESQADDLFQDLFLSFVSKPPPTNIQNIKGYLYRAIINDITDGVRRIERYQALTRRYAEHLKYFKTENNPENILIEAEETDRIFKLIQGRLRNSEAKAIRLRYRSNLKTKEVAAKMGVDSGSVRKYIYRGLKRIRQFLERKQLV